MKQDTPTPGKTTIAPGVLITIIRLSALNVEGVSHLCPVPGGVNRIFKRNASEGVTIQVEDGIVDVDLYVALENNTNVREIGRNIQTEVARAITEMVGMQVGRINIHIEEITYPSLSEDEKP